MWNKSSAALILNNYTNTPSLFLSLRASATEPHSVSWGQTTVILPRIKVMGSLRGRRKADRQLGFGVLIKYALMRRPRG